MYVEGGFGYDCVKCDFDWFSFCHFGLLAINIGVFSALKEAMHICSAGI